MSRSRPAGLPGVVLGALELPAEAGDTPDFVTWEMRAADLAPGGWGRRIAYPRFRGPLYGCCDRTRNTLWVCVRQNNVNVAQTLTHEVSHAVYPREAGKARGEQWAEVTERVVGLLLRAGALRLTLRDRQIDAVRRQLLTAAEAAQFEVTGRLEAAAAAASGVPWARGLGPSEVGP